MGDTSIPVLSTAELAGWIARLGGLNAGVDDAERVEQRGLLEALKAAAAAAQARVSVAFADSQRAAQLAAGVARERAGAGIAEQVALARRGSPTHGHRHLGLAHALVGEMPHTMAALAAGGAERVAGHPARAGHGGAGHRGPPRGGCPTRRAPGRPVGPGRGCRRPGHRLRAGPAQRGQPGVECHPRPAGVHPPRPRHHGLPHRAAARARSSRRVCRPHPQRRHHPHRRRPLHPRPDRRRHPRRTPHRTGHRR